MRAAVSRIVDVDQDAAGKFVLDAKIPLVNLGVAKRVAGVIAVAVPPQSQRAVFALLRADESDWKRILQGGVLSDARIFREDDVQC